MVGASLAVSFRGAPIFSRGFGLANIEHGVPVVPDTVFCIASVTKPITAVGILKLVDEKRLDLDAKVMEVLRGLSPLPGHKLSDPRFHQITVHHLLYHAGGLPRDVSIPDRRRPARDIEQEEEVEAELKYRALLGKPLLSDPGTEHLYSNAGFIVLRLVIERVTGEPYERWIRENILHPMGIRQMRLEHAGEYERGEAHRYRPGGREPAPRLASNWLASATELVRFASAVAGSGGRPFLSETMTQQMLALPPGMKPNRRGGHVGLGWDTVRQSPGGTRFSKNGGKPGIHVWLEHLESGIDWAVMFNTDPPKEKDVLGEARRRLLPIFRRSISEAGIASPQEPETED
jgi:N-acyl-D-amino-acid deacylase